VILELSPQVIIASDVRAGSVSSILPEVHTRSFFLLEEALFLGT